MKKLLKLCVVLLFVCALAAAPIVYEGYRLYRQAVTETPISEKISEIKSSSGYTPLSEMDEYFVEQIIRSEDKRFYYHPGIDPLAIARALKNDILAASFVEGGSTITQQLVKNMYFDFDKVLERKAAEVFAAFRLEWMCSKDEILELYLNCIYYGENCYGIKDAAAYYYETEPANLSEEQADSLVYTIKCPNLYNPVALSENAA